MVMMMMMMMKEKTKTMAMRLLLGRLAWTNPLISFHFRQHISVALVVVQEGIEPQDV
jgi:hypothetical protein